jgi:hypothetical protein
MMDYLEQMVLTVARDCLERLEKKALRDPRELRVLVMFPVLKDHQGLTVCRGT